MSKDLMKKMIEDAVKADVGFDCEVEIVEVEKNNGVFRAGIIIKKTGIRAVPCVYIDEYLELLEKEETTVQRIAKDIVAEYMRGIDESRKLGLDAIGNILDKDSILENVTYKIVNKKKNEHLLVGVPYKEFLDLAVLFTVTIPRYFIEEGVVGAITVNNVICNGFNLSMEELEEAAERNTAEAEFCVMNMSQMLANMSGMPEEMFAVPEENAMYILTNESGHRGANVMLYKEPFAELAEKLGSDLYVLPSSIHEVIAVSTKYFQPENLRYMVHSVNCTEVDDVDYLSDSVYRFNRTDGKLVIV